MYFDVIRAWKDETYRQNLSAEQLNALPANPAGTLDLTDTDLESVYGGRPDGHGSGASQTLTAADFKQVQHLHSLSMLICEVNIYSVQVTAPILPTASPIAEICQKNG